MTPRRRIVPVFIPNLGCPHRCVFCDQRASAASEAVRPEDIAGIVEAARPAAGDGFELAFYGGSFTALPPELRRAYLGAARPHVESGAVAALRVSTRPDCVDGAILDELRAFGVRTVELGAQSADDAVLRLSERGHTAADTERAAARVKAAGLGLILQMTPGLPGDTREHARETARTLVRLKPDGVRIYPVVVLRGTALRRMMLEGSYRPLGLDEAVEWAADCLELFDAAAIPVLRVGLHPTGELEANRVAGPYDPALGTRAWGRLFRRRAEAALEALGETDGAALLCHAKDCAHVLGYRKENLPYLRRRFGLDALGVRAADMPRGRVRAERADARG